MLLLFLIITGLILKVIGLLSVVGSYFLLVPMYLFFGGILLYWWWVLLFKVNKNISQLKQLGNTARPTIQSLKDWSKLHQEMILSDDAIESSITNTHYINQPFWIWFVGLNLLFVWIIFPLAKATFFIPGIPINSITPWLIGTVGGFLAMVMITPGLYNMSKKRSSYDVFIPLGFKCTTAPLSLQEDNRYGEHSNLGYTVFEGNRWGRETQIKIMKKSCITTINAESPKFSVACTNYKFVPSENAPYEIKKFFERLPRNKRWNNTTVESSSDSIRITRESDEPDMWLYDLWLAETIDKINQDSIIRIHQKLENSKTNGPGNRAVIWVQGCTLNCPGCFNPKTHDPKGGEETSVDELIKWILSLGDTIEGISISGGEPLQQMEPILNLLQRIAIETMLSTFMFSGYTSEEIKALPQWPTLAGALDILLCGRYDKTQKLDRGIISSANQEMLFLSKRYTPADMDNIPDNEIIILPNGETITSGVGGIKLN
jgi:anaerobic ribonucleoside-triphosphate reductase activating protein